MKRFFSLMFASAIAVSSFSGCGSDADVASVNSSSNGKAGSTARFAFSGNTLYTLSNKSLIAFDASNPRQGLTRLDSVNVVDRWWGREPETVFPFGDYILMGTPNGMVIYQNQGGQLQYVSTYAHIESCDPVVAQGNYAYVTLRVAGTRCSRGVDQLEVIDISRIETPYPVAMLPMNKPFGLAVNGEDLFVCEENRLAHLDVSNPSQPTILRRYDVKGSDCIYDRGRLLVVGPSGLTQFQIDGDQLTQLSRLAVTRTP